MSLYSKNIGGFFELEIAEGRSLFHDDAIKLATGRACLSVILQLEKFSKVYLPFYCCDALFEPLDLCKIPYEFYCIDKELEIGREIVLKPTEALVYCNFFGVKSTYINQLIEVYKDQVIIDNSHAFFSKGYPSNISFTTARKYFGVPDGAFLYLPDHTNELDISRNTNISITHNLNRLLGYQEQAYQDFIAYEASLNSDVNLISVVSEKLLKTVDYNAVRRIRNANFNFFKEEFQELNQICLDENAIDCFCYPLLLEREIDKQVLFDQNIFIPSYWLDVVRRKPSTHFEFEAHLSTALLPLPIDHRYKEQDLKRVSDAIKAMI